MLVQHSWWDENLSFFCWCAIQKEPRSNLYPSPWQNACVFLVTPFWRTVYFIFAPYQRQKPITRLFQFDFKFALNRSSYRSLPPPTSTSTISDLNLPHRLFVRMPLQHHLHVPNESLSGNITAPRISNYLLRGPSLSDARKLPLKCSILLLTNSQIQYAKHKILPLWALRKVLHKFYATPPR